MGFAVTIAGGTKDAEFEIYSRLLRQRGVDLGNAPRTPDPERPTDRWAYVWPTRAEAEEFAAALNRQTRGRPWRVSATAAPPSYGPLGPILIQLVRRSDGLVFALHPLSRAMILAAFPDATPSRANLSIGATAWSDFQRTQGDLAELVREMVPVLTGLSLDAATEVGYAVLDGETDQTWVYVAPAGVQNGHVAARPSQSA